MADIITQFAFLLLLSIISISDAGSLPKSVVIKNDLGSGLVLSFRCLSADDDLGSRLLPPGESWGFHFNTITYGNTLFHCGFKWAQADEKKFSVYDDNQHHYKCSECSWSIQRNGTCFSSDSITAAYCYPWSPAWPTPVPDNGYTT